LEEQKKHGGHSSKSLIQSAKGEKKGHTGKRKNGVLNE